MLDAVYLPVRNALGAKRRPLLVACGIDVAGTRAVIDFPLASSESEAALPAAGKPGRSFSPRSTPAGLWAIGPS